MENNKYPIYEAIMHGIRKSLNENFGYNEETDTFDFDLDMPEKTHPLSDKQTASYQEADDFRIFINAMHGQAVYDTDGPCGDINDALPALKVAELGLEKMFQYQYSENDEVLKLLTSFAEHIGYGHFMETITKNSIEAKKRYQEQHICRRYLVSGTCGWPCTIKADENGWSTEFGMDGDHYENVAGHTPNENFKAAYAYAEKHYGKLVSEKR